MDVVNPQIDAELDEQLQEFVPQRYRGERKVALRIEYALRDWIETRKAESEAVPTPPRIL